MTDDLEILAQFERIGAFRAFVRKPRLLASGNIVEFFIGNDSLDVDAALALGMKKFHDAEVYLTIHLLKHPDGSDAKLPAAVPGKPYGGYAAKLYQRGFFRAQQVQGAIRGTTKVRPPGLGADAAQSEFAEALAAELGQESMGHVPPQVFAEWAKENELEWLLPQEYREHLPTAEEGEG